MNSDHFDLLKDLFQSQSEKLDSLTDKVDCYHQSMTERIHKIETQVDSHDKTFKAVWGIGGSGIGLALLASIKNLFFPQH